MNNSGDRDYYFDRNQDVCNISRTMYMGKSCWKRASQLQMRLPIRTLISAGGRAAGTLRLPVFPSLIFILRWHLQLLYLLLRSSCIWGIINCKINTYLLTWKWNVLVNYRTGCLFVPIEDNLELSMLPNMSFMGTQVYCTSCCLGWDITSNVLFKRKCLKWCYPVIQVGTWEEFFWIRARALKKKKKMTTRDHMQIQLWEQGHWEMKPRPGLLKWGQHVLEFGATREEGQDRDETMRKQTI